MKPMIGVFLRPEGLQELKAILEPAFSQRCSFRWFPLSELSEAPALFAQAAPQLDALLFEGRRYYRSLADPLGEPELPYATLDVDQSELYRLLLRLTVQEKQPPQRISVDCAGERNDYLGLRELLSPERLPVFYTGERPIDDSSYTHLLEHHLRLYRRGEIDCVITGHHTLLVPLREAGIPTYALGYTPTSVVQTIELLLIEVFRRSIRANLAAIALVRSGVPTPRLVEAMEAFSRIKGVSLPYIVLEDGCLRIVTTNAVLLRLTDNYSDCALWRHLETLGITASIGWGIGRTLREGVENARNALRKSCAYGDERSFIHTEDNRIIGPLADIRHLAYLNESDGLIDRISAACGLSSLYIQKVLSVVEKIGSDTLSCSDMAYYLGISVRSANRVLNRLEDCGFATATARPGEGRGRPSKLYRIAFPEEG